MKNEISRRGFLISSTVGATGLLFAQPSMAGTTVVNLLDPGSPLVIPENFSPSVWFTMQSSARSALFRCSFFFLLFDSQRFESKKKEKRKKI